MSRGCAGWRVAALIFAAGCAAAGAGAAEDQAFGTLELLPHIADEVMVRWQVPGLALGVVRADGEIFEGGFGTTRVGGAEPVTCPTCSGNSKSERKRLFQTVSRLELSNTVMPWFI